MYFGRQTDNNVFLRVLACSLGVFLLFEIIAVAWVWYGPLPCFQAENISQVVLRAKRAAHRAPYILLLGDSVLGHQSLAKAGYDNPIKNSLSSCLIDQFKELSINNHVVSFPEPGALSGDLISIVELLNDSGVNPALAIIQIDYRIFSPLHNAEGNLSRKWLSPYFPDNINLRLSKDNSARFGYSLDNIFTQALVDYSYLFLLGRSLHASLTQISYNAISFIDFVPDGTAQQIRRMKIYRYYSAGYTFENSEAMFIMEALLDRLRARNIPTMLIFTPSNLSYLRESINLPVYRANLAYFQSWFNTRYSKSILMHLMVMQDMIPDDFFIDHTHLKPSGNRLASQLVIKDFALWWDKSLEGS